MGAWDYGIFDDDTAYDFDDEIMEDAKTFFRHSFETALEDDYLGYDEGIATLVSAAYMDNLLNGTQYRTDNQDNEDESNVNMFGRLRGDLRVDDLKPLAVRALGKVIGENSELNELWSDNEELYPKWKGNIEELMTRLK